MTMTLFETVARACFHDDLDQAVATIQRFIGVTDGGFASHFFDRLSDDTWRQYDMRLRAETLFYYIQSEFFFAHSK